jgi:hypothetical protein
MNNKIISFQAEDKVNNNHQNNHFMEVNNDRKKNGQINRKYEKEKLVQDNNYRQQLEKISIEDK